MEAALLTVASTSPTSAPAIAPASAFASTSAPATALAFALDTPAIMNPHKTSAGLAPLLLPHRHCERAARHTLHGHRGARGGFAASLDASGPAGAQAAAKLACVARRQRQAPLSRSLRPRAAATAGRAHARCVTSHLLSAFWWSQVRRYAHPHWCSTDLLVCNAARLRQATMPFPSFPLSCASRPCCARPRALVARYARPRPTTSALRTGTSAVCMPRPLVLASTTLADWACDLEAPTRCARRARAARRAPPGCTSSVSSNYTCTV
jgi:hypothetical protein